eukprot:753387-Hanusia_phi.AAC.1
MVAMGGLKQRQSGVGVLYYSPVAPPGTRSLPSLFKTTWGEPPEMGSTHRKWGWCGVGDILRITRVGWRSIPSRGGEMLPPVLRSMGKTLRYRNWTGGWYLCGQYIGVESSRAGGRGGFCGTHRYLERICQAGGLTPDGMRRFRMQG